MLITKTTLTVLSSRYIVLDKKSIPMVACNVRHNGFIKYKKLKNIKSYLVSIIKTIIHKSCNK